MSLEKHPPTTICHIKTLLMILLMILVISHSQWHHCPVVQEEVEVPIDLEVPSEETCPLGTISPVVRWKINWCIGLTNGAPTTELPPLHHYLQSMFLSVISQNASFVETLSLDESHDQYCNVLFIVNQLIVYGQWVLVIINTYCNRKNLWEDAEKQRIHWPLSWRDVGTL